MAGLIALREPIVNILFQYGKFDYAATIGTAGALLFYAFGIWSIVGVRVVTSGFYSMQDTRTPVKVAVIALAANIVFSIILMKPLQAWRTGARQFTGVMGELCPPFFLSQEKAETDRCKKDRDVCFKNHFRIVHNGNYRGNPSPWNPLANARQYFHQGFLPERDHYDMRCGVFSPVLSNEKRRAVLYNGDGQAETEPMSRGRMQWLSKN